MNQTDRDALIERVTERLIIAEHVESRSAEISVVDLRALASPSLNADHLPPVACVAMVSYANGYKEPADPMWRVEVNGACADFETENAATNFRNAILSLAALATLPPPEDERVKGLVSALESMIEAEVDYMTINNLGDPEKQHNVKRARSALASYRGGA